MVFFLYIYKGLSGESSGFLGFLLSSFRRYRFFVSVVCVFLNTYVGLFCIYKGVEKVHVFWASCSLLSGGTGVLLLFSGVCF